MKLLAILLSIVLVMGCASPADTASDESSGDVPIPEHDSADQTMAAGTTAAPETETAQAVKVTATIAGHAFQSTLLIVKKGTTVTWRNSDSMNHPVKSSVFASSDIGKDAEFSYTFDDVGTYDVEMTTHPAQKMTVKVE